MAAERRQEQVQPWFGAEEPDDVYEAAGKGYKISVTAEPATGAMQRWSYTTNLDGADAPITGNNPNADMTAVSVSTRTRWKS